MEKEDFEFMSELQTANHLAPSKASQIFLWTIAGLFFWLVIWAAFSEVDERVRGTGQVMPSGDVQVVQSLEGGILSGLLVTEGTVVKKDQPLLRIADVQFASEGQGIEAQKAQLEAKQARLKAESSGQPFVMPEDFLKKFPDVAANEDKLYKSRQNELTTAINIIQDDVNEAEANLAEVKSSISRLARSKGLLQHQADINRRLVEQKAIPEIESLKTERELNETSGNLASAYDSQRSLEAKLNAARKKEEEKRGAFKSQALGDLNEVEAKLSAIKASLTSVNDKKDRTELRSPVDGVVQKVYIKTVGGVIQPAQKLVEIVPSADNLMIRARIAPADVAFLRPGQDVRVKITAYESQIYGALDGKLELISANTTQDSQGNAFFEIDVRTNKNYLGTEDKPLRIFSGMVAETEVIVGKRTILTYLLKPVLRTKDRAFTEK